MDLETLRAYLLSLPGAVATYPFGPQPLVVKVGGKIFALVAEDGTPLQISLKCEPAHVQPQSEARGLPRTRSTLALRQPGCYLGVDVQQVGDGRGRPAA
jgi:hypothetical protein